LQLVNEIVCINRSVLYLRPERHADTGSISILSDSFSCQAGCTIDDTDFNNTPFELAPGESYTGPLFTVTTLSTDAARSYEGFFDVTFGDALGNTFTDSARVRRQRHAGARRLAAAPPLSHPRRECLDHAP
jgi:hypothetical protein